MRTSRASAHGAINVNEVLVRVAHAPAVPEKPSWDSERWWTEETPHLARHAAGFLVVLYRPSGCLRRLLIWLVATFCLHRRREAVLVLMDCPMFELVGADGPPPARRYACFETGLDPWKQPRMASDMGVVVRQEPAIQNVELRLTSNPTLAARSRAGSTPARPRRARFGVDDMVLITLGEASAWIPS